MQHPLLYIHCIHILILSYVFLVPVPLGQAITHDILRPLEQPSTDHPFIFFDQRDSSGYDFKAVLKEIAECHDMGSFIPCQFQEDSVGEKCLNTYNFDSLSKSGQSPLANNASIYAGNFYWHNIHSIFGTTHAPPPLLHRYDMGYVETSFECLVLLREPVDRFLDCYKTRYQPFTNKTFADLSYAELETIMETAADIYGYGCNNEIARTFNPELGYGDEYTNKGGISKDAVHEIKRRLSKCLVGTMTEAKRETVDLIHKFFPFIRPCSPTLHLRDLFTDPLPPRNEANSIKGNLLSLIQKYNWVDLELFDFAMGRFYEQLKQAHPFLSYFEQKKEE